MDSLGPNPTAEDIENEILFYHVMLESLDSYDDDYEVKKRDLERPLQDLQARLQQLQTPELAYQPATPNRSISIAGNERSLPSRERPAPTTNAAPLASAAELGSSTGSSEGVNKRPRQESWSFAQLDAPNGAKRSKHNHGSGSTSVSTPATPATVDSLDDDEAALEHVYGIDLSSARDDVMKKIVEQQRQAELRIKREREDAEFARLLEAQQHTTTASVPTYQPAYQATFNGSGQMLRPPPPAQPAPSLPTRPSIAAPPSLAQQTNQHRPAIKPEYDVSSIAALSQLARRQRPPPSQAGRLSDAARIPYREAGHDFTADSSDDSLSEITPAQFASMSSPRTRLTTALSSLPHFNATSQVVPAPNSYIANGYVPSSARNTMVGGTSVYGSEARHGPQQDHNRSLWEQARQGMRGATDSARDWMEAINSAAGMLGYGAGSSARPEFDILSARRRTLGVGGAAFPRGDDSDGDSDLPDGFRRSFDVFGDPVKVKEELEKLLENIRPDEDIPPERRDQPLALKCRLHEHQKLGLAWLKTQEEGNNKGGILADDMGLGKTIQALALIVARPSEDPARKTTLIVAPVALMKQWEEEIRDQLHSRYRLSVFVYHGAQKKSVSFATLSNYDVVITTFGKLASEYKVKATLEFRRQSDRNATLRGSERLVLIAENSRWYRVIIDEAQCIKNKNTKAAMGACHLNATHRLCMSGTPLMNNVGELYSLIRFLRIKPYNEFEKFQRDFRVLNGSGQHGRERAMQAFQVLLKAILLRRTKKSLVDGKPILQLPERTTEIVHAVFDADEQAYYNSIETQMRLEVNKYLQPGKIGRNYSYILVRLLRLRQACCHPHLIKDFAEDGPGDIPVEDMRKLAATLDQNVVARLMETGGNFECPICYDAAENPTIFFPCGHDVCTECFTRMTDPVNAVAAGDEGNVIAKCPECRAKVDPRKVLNWTAFQNAHMPVEDDQDDLDGNGTDDKDGKEAADATDSEDEDDDDDDDDDESDIDSQGDLRDFVVPDNEVEDEDATDDDEEVKVEEKSRVKAELADETEDDGDLDYVAVPSKSSSQTQVTKMPSGKGKGKIQSKPIRKATSKATSKSSSTNKQKNKGKGKGKAPKEKKKKTLADLKKESLRNAKAKKRYLRRLRRDYIPSAKITKCLEILRDIRDRQEGEKTLVFSQFTSLLDLLEVAIGEEWTYRRYDGSMSAKHRDEAVQDFKRKPDVTVMLVSLKAGNAGLNLTAANQVIVLDPFWNPFIEEQAIDRAHRLGQTLPVLVHRVLVENTVEDRIIALQEQKRNLINQALDEKAGQSVSRLGRAELAYLFGITPSIQAGAD